MQKPTNFIDVDKAISKVRIEQILDNMISPTKRSRFSNVTELHSK